MCVCVGVMEETLKGTERFEKNEWKKKRGEGKEREVYLEELVAGPSAAVCEEASYGILRSRDHPWLDQTRSRRKP